MIWLTQKFRKLKLASNLAQKLIKNGMLFLQPVHIQKNYSIIVLLRNFQ